MANPQQLKRIETTTSNEEESSESVTCLPRDMLVEIASKVSSQSLADLHHLKLTCREMMNITDDSYVYKHASLDEVPFFRIQEIPREASFLARCRSSGNLESLYREGMEAYFRDDEHSEKGLDVVRIAAQEGHQRSKYAFAMIVLMNWSDTRSGFSSRTEEFHEALGNLRFLRNQKCVVRCRNEVVEFGRALTRKVGSGVLWQFPMKHLCDENVPCKNACRFDTRGWAFVAEDDDDDDENVCENCRWDDELQEFCGKTLFIDPLYMFDVLIKHIR